MTMATLEYDWRTQAVALARGGFFVTVEKYWCLDDEGDASGWRWSSFTGTPDGSAACETAHKTSEPMSLAQAKAEAEAWLTEQLTEQLANRVDLSVYAFAGAEVAADTATRPCDCVRPPVKHLYDPRTCPAAWAPDGMIDGGYDAGPVKEDR